MKAKILILSIFCALSAFANPARTSDVKKEGEELIYTVRLKMAYGNSTWTDTFAEAGSSPLRINYVHESSCPRSPGMNVFVRHADTGRWEQTQLSNQLDYYSGGTINAIRFDITQPLWKSITCTWKVYADKGPVNPPFTGGDEKLIGAINHPGGFAKDVALTLDAPTQVAFIRFAVPEFCRNLQVLEVGTVTEGVTDKAKLADKEANLFAVNEGKGFRTSKILASFNSAPGQACAIPVYIQTK